ncbi:MAG: zinc-dependent metalloprotease [Leeuwenhoekiella sp.]
MKAIPFFLFTMFPLICCGQFIKDKDHIERVKGFFDYGHDGKEDKLYLEVDSLDKEFLYVHSLKSGLGSNDIGLDRGQLGGTSIVKFIKAGNKLLLMEPNQKYRALTDNAAEVKSVKEAFGKSVLFGFEIVEEKDSTYIIDLTPFLLQDTHQVTDRLKKQKEGTYKLDKSKSALWMENTKNFPKNTEFEALITLTGEATGRNLGSVVPNGENITITQHHSFVELPDDGYEPRAFDPRSGAIFISFMDYATPVTEPITKRYAIRHRLEKKNPQAKSSEAVAPIIYYLDPGTPEPVRSALLEGAGWWDQAFSSIGYKNAFQVKMLPDRADPMDLRYNVIQWVHRSTRGWSYGASVVDPRTGEIIKGHVSLGSLRIRQDYLIAQALSNKPFSSDDDTTQPMLDLALARIRQLSAHEVGHTLGFAHNFAASVNERASVMDYPHPKISLKDGEVNFDNAYAKGIGAWDKVTVAYSYGDIPSGESEKDYLNDILETAEASGMRFISDSDARASGGAHPSAHLWDNGKNISEELNDVLELRKKAIADFSIDNIRTGEPLSVLEDVFVPLYFYHRYQTEAAVKIIGGLDYTYAVKGDKQQSILQTVNGNAQMEALQAVLKTFSPETLAIPKDKWKLFPPRAFGYGRSRESFKGNTGVTFDVLAPAATASAMTLQLLMHPQRMNRIVAQENFGTDQPKLTAMLDAVINQSFDKEYDDAYLKAIQELVAQNVIDQLKNLYVSPMTIPQVKAEAFRRLQQLVARGGRRPEAFQAYLRQQINYFLEHPDEYQPIKIPEIPDGSPIGSCMEFSAGF